MNVLKKNSFTKKYDIHKFRKFTRKKTDKFNKLTEMKKYKLPFLLADF